MAGIESITVDVDHRRLPVAGLIGRRI